MMDYSLRTHALAQERTRPIQAGHKKGATTLGRRIPQRRCGRRYIGRMASAGLKQRLYVPPIRKARHSSIAGKWYACFVMLG